MYHVELAKLWLAAKPAAAGGQARRAFACDAMSYVGEGTSLAGWYPVKLLPLGGVRKRGWAKRGWWYFQRDKDLYEGAKERFADLNGGNPWEPRPTLTYPKTKSIGIAKVSGDIKKQRDDKLVQGLRAMSPPWRQPHGHVVGDGSISKKSSTGFALSAPKWELRPTWRNDAAAIATKHFPNVYAGNIGVVSDALRAASFGAPTSGYWSRRLEEMRKADVDGIARSRFGDGVRVQNPFDDEETAVREATNTDDGLPEEAGLPLRLKAVTEAAADIILSRRPWSWRRTSPVKPIDDEWFRDDRGRLLPILNTSCPLGHVVDSGAEVADYDAAVQTGNGVRPGETVRLGESVRTGPEPERRPDDKEASGADSLVFTSETVTTPIMPRLALSWGAVRTVERYYGWMTKEEITREADKLLKLDPEPIVITPEPTPQTQCEDAWAAVIRNYAYGSDKVYVASVGQHVLKKFKLGSIGKKEQLRIGEILAGMGWKSVRDKMGRGYANPDRHQFPQ